MTALRSSSLPVAGGAHCSPHPALFRTLTAKAPVLEPLLQSNTSKSAAQLHRSVSTPSNSHALPHTAEAMGCTAVPEELLPAHLRACRLPQMQYTEHYPAGAVCSPHTAAQLPTCCRPNGSADQHAAGHYSDSSRLPAAAPKQLLTPSLRGAQTAAGCSSSSTDFLSPDRKAGHSIGQSAVQVQLSAAGGTVVAVAPNERSDVAAAGRAEAADAVELQASTGPPADTPAILVSSSIHPSTSSEVDPSLAALGVDTAAAPSVADWHRLLQRVATELQMWQSAADSTAGQDTGDRRTDSPLGPVSPVPVDQHGTGSRSGVPTAAAGECPTLRRPDVGAERQPAAAGASRGAADSHAQLLDLLDQMERLLKEGQQAGWLGRRTSSVSGAGLKSPSKNPRRAAEAQLVLVLRAHPPADMLVKVRLHLGVGPRLQLSALPRTLRGPQRHH